MKLKITVVAAAIINRVDQTILISHRHEHVNQGGLWEFPGGKVETGESDFHALQRELHEELGISIDSAEPLMELAHTTYPQYDVRLKTFIIDTFQGEPTPMAAQEIRWVPIKDLPGYNFPEANKEIIKQLVKQSFSIAPRKEAR